MTEHSKDLGELKEADLRSVWPDEAQDFTPWLAEEKGLALLGKTLGMDLELESSEMGVGSFSADIVCFNKNDEPSVLIENQLDETNHKHLGQLLTYAAGLETLTVIWIAQKFTEDHRASLDWLNKITGEKFQFFGLEIELWEIEGSKPAPKFNIIAKPNEWSRDVKKEAKDKILRETQKRQQEFWQSLKDHGIKEGGSAEKRFKTKTPPSENYWSISAGTTETNLVVRINSKTKKITIRLECSGETGTDIYERLEEDRAKIESELGFSPEWLPLDGLKTSAISISTDGDFKDQSKWQEFHKWIIENLEEMDKVFREKLINIKKSLPKIEDEEGNTISTISSDS